MKFDQNTCSSLEGDTITSSHGQNKKKDQLSSLENVVQDYLPLCISTGGTLPLCGL